MRFISKKLILLALVLGSLFLYCKDPSDESVIRSLEALHPELANLGLLAYRNQEWCQVLAYQGKAFSNTNASNCVHVTDLPTSPFSPEASTKLREIAEILSSAKIKILSVEKIHSSLGKITFAEFHVDCEFCRTRYVYSPRYGSLPLDITNELYHYRIDENWYRVEEDWN